MRIVGVGWRCDEKYLYVDSLLVKARQSMAEYYMALAEWAVADDRLMRLKGDNGYSYIKVIKTVLNQPKVLGGL